MKTVLLAWELGANLGHAGPLLRIARALKAENVRPVLALRDIVGPRIAFDADDIEIVQAPVWPKGDFLRGRPFRAASYADILALFGFAEADALAAMVRAWDEILRTIKPDLVVGDHSPTLCLAAYGAIPAAIAGNGYTVPPIHLPTFPPFGPNRPPVMVEARILETVAAVQRRRGRRAPTTLPSLFDAPVRAILTLPELDPYRAVRREPVLGPLEAMPPHTPAPANPHVFAYLGEEHPQLAAIVQCLLEFGGAAEVYLRGDADALRRVLTARGIRAHNRPPPLTETMPRASLVLSHGGSATAHAALCAGRPQLVLPAHSEQELTADALVALGVGVALTQEAKKADIQSALRQAIESDTLPPAAQQRAADAANRPPVDALTEIRNACLGLIR